MTTDRALRPRCFANTNHPARSRLALNMATSADSISLIILSLDNIASGQKSLTLAQYLAILRVPMRHAVPAVGAIQFASSTRRDLLLECLALRHQLGVLARTNRRFRPSERLLWLILRRVWPGWRDALMLIQPATVDRWHRDGFYRCWRRRLRRPGRPRIDSQCRDLMRQMAAANRLWGAPRIHGELLTLGITISERTVSRYLQRDRLMAQSQTWRTFLANHIGQLTFISPATSACASHAVDIIDVPGPSFCQPPSSNHELVALVAVWASIRVLRFNGHHAARIASTTFAKPWPSGTTPAADRRQHGPVAADPRCLTGSRCSSAGPLQRTTVSDDSVPGRVSPSSCQRRRKRLRSECVVRVYVVIRTVVGILAKHKEHVWSASKGHSRIAGCWRYEVFPRGN